MTVIIIPPPILSIGNMGDELKGLKALLGKPFAILATAMDGVFGNQTKSEDFDCQLHLFA